MQNNPEEILDTMRMYSVEEEKTAIDDYWRHIEEEIQMENYWSDEAQRLYAMDRASRIIQNNWKKIYNRRHNSSSS
tara:strand:+ start:612 stop:839 length:228 start_codon:yes stop_codon:yes gene_type:complete